MDGPFWDIHKIRWQHEVKFMFSKKATKIDQIFTSIWYYVIYVVDVKSTVKISSIFVAFLENTNSTM